MPRVLLLSNGRSGSTYLKELMNSHPECTIQDELLNKTKDIQGDVLDYLEYSLAKQPERFVGFKVFPEQIFERGLRLDNLISHIRITYIVVLWRESIVETLISLKIAYQTDVWYSNQHPTTTTKVEIQPEEISELSTTFQTEWRAISEQWPKGIQPIFVKFEDLLKEPDKWLRFVFSQMYCEVSRDLRFFSTSKRQNPAQVWEKVLNWNELPPQLKELKFDAAEILATKIKASSQTPNKISELAPEREPCIPANGWRYRVADPFMPQQLKQNVFDAVFSGSVSSAGFWPRLMSTKLKALFHVPVAQPCSNGFTALMLAMQSAHIGLDDEVIMPSMTMVAVANAISFLGAKPVFVDCMEDNYNPGWEQFQNAITNKTKAIIVTHTYGVPTPNVETIAEQCEKRGFWFIEDISECIGIKVKVKDGVEKLLGTFGHFACASMYVNKMIQAGDGGFVIAKDAQFEARLASLVNHGFTPSYHFVHYEKAINGKINGLGAAMGCGCIDELDEIMKHRMLIANTYRTLLECVPIKLMPVCGVYDTPWVFGLECRSKEERTKLRCFLAENEIETRDYFFPLHLQPAFQSLSNNVNAYYTREAMTNCEKIGSIGLYLPTHSNLLVEDVHFICSVVRAFYTTETETSLEPAPPQKQKLGVQIKPDSFKVEVRNYDSFGYIINSDPMQHLYIDCVKLGMDGDTCIRHERWDEVNIFLEEVDKCIKDATAQGLPFVEDYFSPYKAYFQSFDILEMPICRPWLQINLATEEYISAQGIPTTSEQEITQLLIWLVEEIKPEIVWEIGCWLGHTTYLMAAAGQMSNCCNKIFACDVFKWQKWMNYYFEKSGHENEDNDFKERFSKYTEKFNDVIEAVNWPYDIEKLPSVLLNERPNLVFVDMTTEDEEFEKFWEMMKPSLIPNETIIVFNGLNSNSIQFFTRHLRELLPFTQSVMTAKAFKYVKEDKTLIKEENQPPTLKMLERKVKFCPLPDWDHHHKNLFCESIRLLHKKLHDDHASVLFVPAVEQEICDHPHLLKTNPWIGIIHSVVNYPELFYAPDLQRLCNPSLDKIMKNCKGLFTLTKFQANYLKKNLPDKYSFPIQPLVYPTYHVPDIKRSCVPDIWKSKKSVDLVMIGSFARDFELFFREIVPETLRKVLLLGDEDMKRASKRAPDNVHTMERLSDDEYEEILLKSVLFLALKYDGAANTLILECITRNLPLVAPNLECCIEYMGKDYPLLYDVKNPNLLQVITLENIEKAIKYLQEMDKSQFHPTKFIESVENGAVLLSLNPSTEASKDAHFLDPNLHLVSKSDVTICICSYKRTHHLKQIIESLWNKQDFTGKIQIIIWNNNECRTQSVKEICSFFLQRSTHARSLELITSTENYYCSVRFAMPPLMKSDCLLICDDDMIPNENFVTFFMSAREKYPNDVLCLHGHKFLKHELNVENPIAVWQDYDNLRFCGDVDQEQLIHFVHSDACLIPKRALEEVASMEMPDASFALVDDYWMSFVLNHHFGRRLRKLSMADATKDPVTETSDCNTVGLALHTRPEVQDARIRLYIHHMLQGWPCWKDEKETAAQIDFQKMKIEKWKIWDKAFIGMNITSIIDDKGINDLVKLGVSCVRIGAVGLGRIDPEFSGFHSHIDAAEKELQNLATTVELLSAKNISAVITLKSSLASANTWKLIAKQFAVNPFVVGYDLINEPFTPNEEDQSWIEIGTVEDAGMDKILSQYVELIEAIREVDKMTPIVIESTFWAHSQALKILPMEKLLEKEPEIIISFHFYEPSLLNHRNRNKNQYRFPGNVPVFENAIHSEIIYWDSELIHMKLSNALEWAQHHSVKIFVGEFGICREIPGADMYLKAIIDTCKDLGMSSFLFSFRDEDWDAMDYELGSDLFDMLPAPNWDEGIMKVVVEGIKDFTK